MRVHVRRVMAGGGIVPTASEVVEAVGGTVSLALQVLSEFPEYQLMQGARRHPSLRGVSRVGLPVTDVPTGRLATPRPGVRPTAS